MADDKKVLLKSHLSTIHGAIRRLVDDITEEESMRTIANNPNHIKWLTGHIIFTRSLSAKTLGGVIDTPEGWTQLFRRGAPAPESGTIFPPMADVRTVLYGAMQQVESMLDATTDEHLCTPRVIAPNWEDAPIEVLLFLAAHDFYHGGQIPMIRRAIGRERSFG